MHAQYLMLKVKFLLSWYLEWGHYQNTNFEVLRTETMQVKWLLPVHLFWRYKSQSRKNSHFFCCEIFQNSTCVQTTLSPSSGCAGMPTWERNEKLWKDRGANQWVLMTRLKKCSLILKEKGLKIAYLVLKWNVEFRMWDFELVLWIRQQLESHFFFFHLDFSRDGIPDRRVSVNFLMGEVRKLGWGSVRTGPARRQVKFYSLLLFSYRRIHCCHHQLSDSESRGCQ